MKLSWRQGYGVLLLGFVGCGSPNRDLTRPPEGTAGAAGFNSAGADGTEQAGATSIVPRDGAGAGGEAGSALGEAGSAGEVEKSDPCLGVTCETPPESACSSASEFKSYDPIGTCSEGSCVYPTHAIACSCSAGSCSVDPCQKLTCNMPPAASCKDASTKRVYASTGTCSAGSCSYAPTDTSCSFGCSDGECKADPCSAKICNAPPKAVCKGSALTQYEQTGACSAGTCDYKSTDMSCAFGCANGACNSDPCTGVTCKSPPANSCVGGQFKSFDMTGSCSAGACTYTSHVSTCTCAGNACSTDPCLTVTCATPPAAICKDANTQRRYSSSGTCSAGSCSYSPVDTACSFGCANGACKADPCATVSCASPPAPVCSGSTLVTSTTSGATCSNGQCTYKSSSKACDFGCANGACKPDPCSLVTCNTPPAQSCIGSNMTTYPATGTCSAGNCSYSAKVASCGTNKSCSGSGSSAACAVCKSASSCGPSCSACSGSTSKCKDLGSTSQCVACLVDADCGGTGNKKCNTSSNSCVCTPRYNGDNCQYLAFQGVGVLSGDDNSEVHYVSHDGKIVLGSSNSEHPFRWINGVKTPINVAHAANVGCTLTATNSAGAIVVNCDTPFLYTDAQGAVPIDLFPNAGSVNDINPGGDIMIGGTYRNNMSDQGFRRVGTGIQLFGYLDSGPTVATAESGDGSLVVGYGGPTSGQGFRWTPQGGIQKLASMPDWNSWYAEDVSTDGKVIIGWSSGDQDNQVIKWTAPNFGLTDIGPGFCWQTNSNGSVIVGNFPVDSSHNVAAVWDGTGSHKLTDLLGPTPDLSGWTLENAQSVSDDGKFVVGYGEHNGNTEGWVAHLP